MKWFAAIVALWFLISLVPFVWAQQPAPSSARSEAPPKEENETKPVDNKRIELNLLGNPNAQNGESRRNETFNLIW